MSSCMDISLIGAALIWFLTGFRQEQVGGCCTETLGEPITSQALIWFCVFYAIGFALT